MANPRGEQGIRRFGALSEMRNWRTWKDGRQDRSDRARRAAQARWDRAHAEDAVLQPRQSRFVEIMIRDSHRTQRTIRLTAEDNGHAWSRWTVHENGVRIGRRAFGKTAIAGLLARSLM